MPLLQAHTVDNIRKIYKENFIKCSSTNIYIKKKRQTGESTEGLGFFFCFVFEFLIFFFFLFGKRGGGGGGVGRGTGVIF